ncbi:MAG: hypothetical protein ABI707_10535 [Ferruginibacter sp.]
METNVKQVLPDEIPGIPEEVPTPEKMPEVEPTIVPETPALPEEDPGTLPDEGPFQPDIPTEVPPSIQ